MKKTALITLLSVTLLVTLDPALAHHVMDSAVPQTFLQGLLSGIGHPVISVDHLAFVIGTGIAAAYTFRNMLAPLVFLTGTVFGCFLLLIGIDLPITEVLISASVLVLGVMILSGRRVKHQAGVVLFAIAGLFHGSAYGGSIIGAETTPIVAYLIGFVAVQYTICLAAMQMTRSATVGTGPSALYPRLAGAMIAGIGVAFLVESIEASIFV